jgi:hypothetical protein
MKGLHLMKRLLIAFFLFIAATSLFAQSATLASPIAPPSQTNYVVGNVTEHRADPNATGDLATATIELWVMTAGGVKADTLTVFLSGNTEVNALEVARTNVAASETGSGARIQNFRVLTYLKASCATFARPCPGECHVR